MYKITVKGEAKTDYSDIYKLQGIDCQDSFAEYFDDDFTFKNNIKSGYLQFEVSDFKLWSITVYNSDRRLTQEELEILKDYTQGQWSDGIGEGFEQEPCMYDEDEKEVFISPWFFGQEISITQKEV